MPKLKLFLDTNIVIDYLNMREPFYESARLLMLVGRIGDFQLSMSPSQFTDLLYILSSGGKSSEIEGALKQIRAIRTFINVCKIDHSSIDRMLYTSWKDPEDFLLYDCALEAKADFIITRNPQDFEDDLIKPIDCDGLFSYVRETYGIDYCEMEI